MNSTHPKFKVQPNLCLCLCLCLWLTLTACQTAAEPTPTILDQVPNLSGAEITAAPDLDPDAVAQGAELYATHCASCHGANLEGEANWQAQNEDDTFRAPPHDATGHTWHHADPVLLEAIALGGARLPAGIGGTSPMPAFTGVFTEAEMTAVLAYIKSSWPADVRQMQWEQTQMQAALEQ